MVPGCQHRLPLWPFLMDTSWRCCWVLVLWSLDLLCWPVFCCPIILELLQDLRRFCGLQIAQVPPVRRGDVSLAKNCPRDRELVPFCHGSSWYHLLIDPTSIPDSIGWVPAHVPEPGTSLGPVRNQPWSNQPRTLLNIVVLCGFICVPNLHCDDFCLSPGDCSSP